MSFKAKYSVIKIFYILVDCCIIFASIFIACWLRRHTLSFPITFSSLLPNSENPFSIIFLIWIVLVIIFNNARGLYQTRRELLEGIEIWQVVQSVLFASLTMIAVKFILKTEGFPRGVFLIATACMIALMSLWRVFKRAFVEYLVARGYNNVNVLIVGAGKVGVALAKEIEKRPGLGIKVIGFLDDFKQEIAERKDLKVLGKISDFSELAHREFVDKIFITIHHDHNAFLDLLGEAQELGIAIRVIPQGFDLISGDFFRYNIGFIPILEYSDIGNLRRQTGKRLFDFIIALLLFVPFLLVWFVIAIIIKRDSPGPVLYVSKRYGRGGRIFNMYKFRSMVEDAEVNIHKLKDKNEVDGPIFKIRNDPRVTKIGRFLRRYSLDELPQIINVLKGDMSLVGPRPFPIEQIEREDLRQLKRLQVRPGITGLWQIRGRSDISFDRLIKWDIWYINNWSLWLDVNILLQTAPIVLQGKGAY